ncbi:MAG: beta-phosphoglucomutase [Candidatus Omnitrophica bacterium CG11_big_fil_rev_8_21_14_0_20_42_13]|uniref:Beta-phosphoglucomutase n=1 Tax=Candidatus Ghiorseimicrobium undicola TaxID=1974746 RepID=A0A2H0LZT7_9BACT|nr:MAG: beta-phosphoglucomutase [Candidatus Omnitrophica bacterium CG11_big_fil_rev_8_21_14_0_20_42_13]
MFKGAIFDVDGVIVDTVPLHFAAWEKMFSEYGINFTFEDYKHKVDGIPRNDGARAILSGLNDEEIKEAATKKQGYFLQSVETENIPAYPTTIQLVKEFKKAGKKIAFASSSKNCKLILTKIGVIQLADTIVDGNDITRGKPDPQIFQIAADRLGCAYAECVVFEDAVLGVKAAKNGGMACVGVDRYNHPQRLKDADIVVDDLNALDSAKIERLFKG